MFSGLWYFITGLDSARPLGHRRREEFPAIFYYMEAEMEHAFFAYKMQVDAHVFWVAKSAALKGCVGQGDSLYEAIAELESNEKEWMSAAEMYDIKPCISKLP